jgi:hypothetical protein
MRRYGRRSSGPTSNANAIGKGRLQVFAGVAVGRIASDAQLKMPMNSVSGAIPCFSACVMSAGGGLAALESDSFRNEDGTGCLSGPSSAKPQELLPHMARKAVTRAFTVAADTRFDGAVNPFHDARLVATIQDAVTTWGCQLLPTARANTLQRGVKPLPVHLRCDAAGHCGRTVRRLARRCAPGDELWRGDRHFARNALSAQANAVDSNGDSRFYTHKLGLFPQHSGVGGRMARLSCRTMMHRKRRGTRRRRPHVRIG